MSAQTVTRTIESDLEPGKIFAVLRDATLLPRWAPAFADAVEPLTATTFRLTRNNQPFTVELIANETALTVDVLLDMPNGRRGGAYIRTMPRPLGGSNTVMTVPIGPQNTEASVADTLTHELTSLIELASR